MELPDSELIFESVAKLQWVSEWHIKDDPGYPERPYRVSNNGLYTSASDMKEAGEKLAREIESEKIGYIVNKRTCLSCGKMLYEHDYNDMEMCLLRNSKP